MSTPSILALIPALPLLGFLVNGLLGKRLPTALVSLVACGLPALAFVLTAMLFFDLRAGGAPVVLNLYTWAVTTGFQLDAALYFDAVTAVMGLVITGIGTLIHIYSVGYMKGDESYSRYFAYLNLFLFFMLVLVLGKIAAGDVRRLGRRGPGQLPADRLLVRGPAKAGAGLKAFVVNRVGDAGFLLACSFMIQSVAGTLDFQAVNTLLQGAHRQQRASSPPSASAAAGGRLRQVGADPAARVAARRHGRPHAGVGADPRRHHGHRRRVPAVAPERPVPGHARRHDGGGRLGRYHGVLVAATIGRAEFDIKKVLAYSTMSQLGLMFMASAWAFGGRSSTSTRTPSSRPACSWAPAA
jgi:NADH-quinone oxidoreductase subunit L